VYCERLESCVLCRGPDGVVSIDNDLELSSGFEDVR